MSFVRLRRSSNIDITSIRQRQTNIDVVLASGLVVAPGPLDHDPACGNAEALFELSHMLGNQFAARRIDGIS
jgi:hypothetical protein